MKGWVFLFKFAAIGCLFVFSTIVNADSKSHQMFADTGYSTLKGQLGNENAWVTNVGYSYFLSPYVGLDVGHTNIVSESPQYSNENLDRIDLSYQGFFGGAHIQHPVKSIGFVYAKGGVSYTTLEEVNLTSNPNSPTEYSGTHPYFGVGIKINTFMQPNLDVNIEYIHQELEGDYSNSSFLVGASFKL
ncbi:outer membrane beta-barrel protein [uncultured Vibrio sp.]|uniref:outer membrane beta-barrel protein n=1 Tax=uncultured Vibrio sp. TaxID=114054 RepID=UPI0025E187DE|nr:outer membrane beta-barrel protein [uncultured Vibrio sp.]